MATETQIFILWERARTQQEKILADMRKRFDVYQMFEITWTSQLVASNFTRFYGQNLPSHSFKELECGTGAFLLCVVKDTHPIYEIRTTSHGNECVNINLFDAKTLYREWTGGGHKVHCSTNLRETNHDMTLLLGLNVDDFYKQYPNPNEHIIPLKRDLQGAHGWESLTQLFYVLNNTVRYAVMRGYGEISSGEFIDHKDTDIMTDEYQNMWLIINAEGFFFHPVRPKAGVRIKDTLYYLNLWDCGNLGKRYFDITWVKNMLDTSVYWKGLKILSPENDFYCLLYHCLTNKGYIADDYLPKLENYKKLFHIVKDDWNEILVDFLQEHNYDIIKHTDPSNPFNISNPIINKYATRWGVCFRTVDLQSYDKQTNELLQWESRVYEKENSFVKKGTPWLIENERNILSQIDLPFVPKLLADGRDGAFSWIEISRIQGADLDKFLEVRKNFTTKNIRSIVQSSLKRIYELYKLGVMHRDIIPGNILVFKRGDMIDCNIIDYGSSILYKEDKEFPSPRMLGETFAPDNMYSDFYSLGKVLLSICRKMPYLKRIASELSTIQWDNYGDAAYVEQVVKNVNMYAEKTMTFRDYYAFFRKKYAAWRIYIDEPTLIPKKMLKRIKRALILT